MSKLWCIMSGCKKEADYVFRGNSLCAEHAKELEAQL